MDTIVTLVGIVVLGIIFIIFFLLIFKTDHTQETTVVKKPREKTLNEILKDYKSTSDEIQKAFNTLWQDEKRFLSDMPASIKSYKLFLRHKNCNAKMFARTTIEMSKKYPDYRLEFEAINREILQERSR